MCRWAHWLHRVIYLLYNISLPSHITASVGLKAQCTVFIYSPNSRITFHSYNDKPVSSPHSVNNLHFVFFFPALTAESPPSRDDGCVLKNFIYNIRSSLRTTSDLLSAVCVWHSEQEESCCLSIVCRQSEQDVCACTGRGACDCMCVHMTARVCVKVSAGLENECVCVYMRLCILYRLQNMDACLMSLTVSVSFVYLTT